MDKSLDPNASNDSIKISLTDPELSVAMDNVNYPASNALSGETTTAVAENGLGQYWKATFTESIALHRENYECQSQGTNYGHLSLEQCG